MYSERLEPIAAVSGWQGEADELLSVGLTRVADYRILVPTPELLRGECLRG